MAEIYRTTVPKHAPVKATAPRATDEITSAAQAVELGIELNDQLQPQAALRMLERALELDPGHAGAIIELANTLLDAGHTDEGLRRFEDFLLAHPGEADVRLAHCRALLRSGRLERAVEQGRRCLVDRPNWDAPHQPLIVALSRLGRLDEAKAVLDDFRRFAPDARTVEMLGGVIERALE